MKNYKYARKVCLALEPGAGKFEKVQITNSRIAADFARQFYHEDIELYESFFIMLCNQANEVIAWAKISQGGVTGTVADPILIAKYCVDSLAKGCVLVHNHLSGNRRPSTADETLTQKVKNGLAFLDVRVLDHIILTSDSYLSFTDEGLL